MPAPITTKAELLDALREAGPALRALGVVRLRLFGSFVRDEARADSDVDLLVDFAPGALRLERVLTAADALEARLRRRVEFITPDALSPYLGPHILQEAEDVVLAA
jgi:uncharacterized protein